MNECNDVVSSLDLISANLFMTWSLKKNHDSPAFSHKTAKHTSMCI